MFSELDGFEELYSQTSSGSGAGRSATSIRRRKTLRQVLSFWMANAVALPIVALCYLSIGAEGLRGLMGVFALRLYKLPVPGAAYLEYFDGWNRLDLAMLMALALCAAVSFIWFKLFTELMGRGHLASQQQRNPALFYLLLSIAAIVVLGDCGIFYLGLESKAATGWGETPAYVPIAATLVYMAGLAMLGAWHADYHCSETI